MSFSRIQLGATVAAASMACAAAALFSAPAFAAPYPTDIELIIDTVNSLSNSATTGLLGVVNRPDSPFVTGLATDTPANSCSPGVWTRGNGDSTTTKAADPITFNSGTVEFGADISCFNLNNAGVDISVGAIGGRMHGVGTIELTPGEVDVDDNFYGLYTTLSAGPVNADLQVRDDRFSFVSNGIPTIDDGTSVTAERIGISGSLQYTMKLTDDFALVPAIGFDVSRTTASTLTIGPNFGSVDPIQGNVAYIGATLAKSIVLPDGMSQLQPFVTATYYADFSPAITASINGTPIDPLSGSGSFTELSAGLNYAKLLGSGPGIKQVSATVRADAKFSDTFSGAGLTGQLRLQF